jgi:hypothetical protein
MHVPPSSLHVMVFMVAFLPIPAPIRYRLRRPGFGTVAPDRGSAPAPREARFDLRFGSPSKFAEAKNRQNLFENHNPC